MPNGHPPHNKSTDGPIYLPLQEHPIPKSVASRKCHGGNATNTTTICQRWSKQFVLLIHVGEVPGEDLQQSILVTCTCWGHSRHLCHYPLQLACPRSRKTPIHGATNYTTNLSAIQPLQTMEMQHMRLATDMGPDRMPLGIKSYHNQLKMHLH